jgi:hypothetical protein
MSLIIYNGFNDFFSRFRNYWSNPIVIIQSLIRQVETVSLLIEMFRLGFLFFPWGQLPLMLGSLFCGIWRDYLFER